MSKTNKDIKIRRNWGNIKPYERIIDTDKVYDRASFRRGLKEEINEMDYIKSEGGE